MGKKVTRLYEQFQPEHYDLNLDVDPEAMTFNGTVAVRGKKVGRPSERITFHQKDLKITSASIVKHGKKGDQAVEVNRVNNQNSYDEVRLHADKQLYPGEYTVTMEFSGVITEPMHGIYPSFFEHDGRQKKLIATQFESHHAREAFPNIDEPEAKATFDLALVTPAGETVLANTPIKEQKDYASKDGGRTASNAKAGTTTPLYQITTFETTPKMSTYLLAFAFGEIHGVTGKTKDGTVVRSWATVAQPLEHLSYANDEAIKSLEFFTDYFGIPFPLPKLDQIALPDFDSLAMENWGLITYREVGLLADPINRSISGEQLITLVIAHEVSHQWFGNLVTMKWWDDLWLNESFASIMENIAPDRLHPDWQQWEDFAIGRVLSAAHRDIYKDVQSVSVEVKHPDEIVTLFDPAIVYAKGARLLNMLYGYMGEAAFRKGLKQYFEKHSYGNTERGDLWEAFAKASGQDIDRLMTPWLIQSGMPLVRVKRVGGKQLLLSQQRFLLDGEDKERLWPIPLLTDVKLAQDIFDTRQLAIDYDRAAIPLFNLHGNGHYIVSYEDEAARQAVREHIVLRTVDSLSRINLLNDMLLLSRAGEFDLTAMLDIIKQGAQEPRDAVWSMFSRTIAQAQLLTDGDKTVEQQLKLFRRNLTSYWYPKLGWQDGPKDDPNTKHLRSTILALSVAGEDEEAIDQALRLFAKAGSVENLPAEQRAIIGSAVVRFGEPEVIDKLMAEYTAGQNPDVRESITIALCATRDPATAKKIIEWGISEKGVVRPQDIAHWYAYLLRNHYTRELAWQWLVGSWPRLRKLFGDGKHMDYFVWYSSGPLSTHQWQKRFKDFFEPMLDEPSLKRNIQIAFGEIAARVEWRKREEPKLKAYFKA
jgi:aminopeptidase N